jgi:phage terminase large subunit GpA-like protein
MNFCFTEGERHIFRRRPEVQVSQWASSSIFVQDGPYRGTRLRLEVNPYLAGIMDAWGQPEVEEVCVCGAPQTGKTLAMYSCLGFCIDRRPGTKMIGMPDDKVLGRVEVEKLRPLLTKSPVLKRLVGKMTNGHIRFKDGSSLYLSSAQSPAQRASITVQDLFLDEEDLYLAAAGRGDPVTDFIERTRSYSFDRKIMRVSKPVGDARSSIWKAITRDMDMIMAFEAKCYFCGAGQILSPEGLTTSQHLLGNELSANDILAKKMGRYKCSACNHLWEDHHRNVAVSKGRWVPVKLVNNDWAVPRFEKVTEEGIKPKKIGFWLPAILSQTVSLSELLARVVRAKRSDNLELKQAQANGDWAMPYLAIELEPSEKVIISRIRADIPARAVPHGAVALTCGVDVQKRGFYYLVLAWMPDMSRYVIDYGTLQEFDQVTNLVWATAYPVLTADGSQISNDQMEIWRCAMDTGGGATEGVYTRTEEVYEYLRLTGFERICGIKGASRDQTPTVRWTSLDKMPRSGKAIPGGLVLYTIDTGKIKSSMFFSLLQEDFKRPTWLYGYDPDKDDQTGLHSALIEHLTSERQVRTSSGRLVWDQVKKDNHWLDCLMMATACGDVSWTPSLNHEIMRMKAEQEYQKTQPVRSEPIKRNRPRTSAGW